MKHVPRQLPDMQEEEEGVLQTLAGAEQVTSASTGREPWRAAEGQALDEEAVQDAAEDEQQQAPPTGGSSGSTAAASPARQAAPPEPATSLTTTSSTGLEGDLSPDSIQVCAVNAPCAHPSMQGATQQRAAAAPL